jgi:hypothetical protein
VSGDGQGQDQGQVQGQVQKGQKGQKGQMQQDEEAAREWAHGSGRGVRPQILRGRMLRLRWEQRVIQRQHLLHLQW